MDNQKSTFKSVVVPIFVEVLIILVLAVSAIGVLNYFKVIKLSELFSNEDKAPAINSTNQATLKKTNKVISSAPITVDPAQPDIKVLIKNKALRYALTTSEFEGKIEEVVTKPGVDTQLGASYGAKLTINVGESNDSLVLLYPEKSLSAVEVSDGKNPLKLADLKKNDKVSINTSLFDFAKYPDNIYKVVITRK